MAVHASGGGGSFYTPSVKKNPFFRGVASAENIAHFPSGDFRQKREYYYNGISRHSGFLQTGEYKGFSRPFRCGCTVKFCQNSHGERDQAL
jgi:hypothetical protein